MLLKVREPVPYFLKAYETWIILKGSSAQEDSDLKNPDVMRCHGFSQHLMHSTLTLNHHAQTLKDTYSDLALMLPDATPVSEDTPVFCLTHDSIKQTRGKLYELKNVFTSLCDKLEIQKQLVLASQPEKLARFKTMLQELYILTAKLPKTVTQVDAATRIQSAIESSI